MLQVPKLLCHQRTKPHADSCCKLQPSMLMLLLAFLVVQATLLINNKEWLTSTYISKYTRPLWLLLLAHLVVQATQQRMVDQHIYKHTHGLPGCYCWLTWCLWLHGPARPYCTCPRLFMWHRSEQQRPSLKYPGFCS